MLKINEQMVSITSVKLTGDTILGVTDFIALPKSSLHDAETVINCE